MANTNTKTKRINITGVEETIKNLDAFGRIATKTMATTMNEAGKYAIRQAIDATRKVYNLKLKDLNSRDVMHITKATMSSPSFVMKLKTTSIPLSRFNAKFRRVRGLGVSFKIMKNGPRGVLPHAFMATNARGTHVLMRKGKDRYPLIPFAVITPTTAFKRVKGDKIFVRKFIKRFNERYEHNLNYYTSKL